jgi:hypothetical protein
MCMRVKAIKWVRQVDAGSTGSGRGLARPSTPTSLPNQATAPSSFLSIHAPRGTHPARMGSVMTLPPLSSNRSFRSSICFV